MTTNRDYTPMERQVIALAGAAQAAKLVDQISRTGSCPPTFLAASVNSLFAFESDSVDAVYGGVAGVKLGLQTLSVILNSRDAQQHQEMVRYLFGMTFLERKFSADSAMMDIVHSRLQHTQYKSEHFTDDLNSVCHSVSAIYQDTLSKQKFRIKVSGVPAHLQDQRNADAIRTLLLAGIRSVFLWRQLGGRRWRLLLQRKRILKMARDLSRDLSHSSINGASNDSSDDQGQA